MRIARSREMVRAVDVSVVIPALNERRALPRTLGCLASQSGRFEIIVVDGGSTDGTPQIARAHAGTRVITAPKGRASQMNAGARLALGDWLLFLHADTTLPAGAVAKIAALQCDAGAFRHAFSGRDWRLRAVSWLHNQRCRFTRVYFGDQGMFVRTELFRRLGGFPEVPILEDVLLCEKLRRVTRPALLDDRAVTDARKFMANGRMADELACAGHPRPASDQATGTPRSVFRRRALSQLCLGGSISPAPPVPR